MPTSTTALINLCQYPINNGRLPKEYFHENLE
jgi:hypothetical protein